MDWERLKRLIMEYTVLRLTPRRLAAIFLFQPHSSRISRSRRISWSISVTGGGVEVRRKAAGKSQASTWLSLARTTACSTVFSNSLTLPGQE